MLVGENGQITPLGHPVLQHIQENPTTQVALMGRCVQIIVIYYFIFQGKIRDVDLGADSSASAESETDDVSTEKKNLIEKTKIISKFHWYLACIT